MFFGYISTFIVAALLSFLYLGYAASGAIEQIKKEIKSENTIVDTGSPSHFVYIQDLYIAEVCHTDLPPVFTKPSVSLFICRNEKIPIRQTFTSDLFQRPPPLV